MSEEISLLPLGTAISLHKNDSVYIIISKGLTRQPDGQFLANYTVILHPYGITETHQPMLIAENAITAIHFLGYEDELDDMFVKQQLSEAITSAQQMKDEDMATDYSKDTFEK